MTNSTIIVKAALGNNIYTEEQVKEMLETEGCLPLHTFKEWNRLGYKVKKGEHAKLVCDIWQMTRKKKTDENEEENNHFFLKKAFFFTDDQVEKIATV